MGGLHTDRDSDELIWTLFQLRVAIVESQGSERAALEEKEHALVEELSDLLDPHVHVDLPRIVFRASPPMF